MLNVKTFNQLFDFTRSGPASYWDANGVLQQAGTNTPRFDYDPVTKNARGLLIEEQRTNLCYQSAALATSPWSLVGTGTVAGIYTATGPDGSMVDSLTGSSTYASRTQQTTTVAASTTYVLSGFFRTVDAAATKFHASLPNSLIAGSQVVMNWSGSTLTSLTFNAPATGNFQAVGGGWYRVWCAFTTNASDVGVATIRVYPSNSEGTALSVFAWGIQLEVGSFPTSYIPTTAGTAQRNADVCKLQTALMPLAHPNLLASGSAEQLDNAAWAKGSFLTVVPNTTVAPDGNTSAEAIVENTTASQFHYMNQTLTKAPISQTYTFSFYIKNLGGREVAFTFSDNVASGVAGRFSPALGTVVSQTGAYGTGFTSIPATITSVGNGWYRCTGGCTTNSATQLGVQVSLHNVSLGTNVYTGDGTSGAYVWGLVLEQGAVASTYTNAGTRTNLLTYSEQFDNAAWPKAIGVTLTPNTTVAPDGNTTADKLIEGTALQQHLISQSIGVITAGASYTFSVYAKAAERTKIALTSQAEPYVVFDLSAGTVVQTGGATTTATITSVGNGWYRCCATFAKQNTTGQFHMMPWTTTNNYTGNGASGLYVWGAMVEVGSTATPYISTTSAARTVTDLLPFSVLMEYEPPSVNSGAVLWGIAASDGFATSAYLSALTGSNLTFNDMNGGIQSPVVAMTPTLVAGQIVRGGVSFGPIKKTALGTRGGVKTALTSPQPATVMYLGASPWGGGNYLNGWIRDFELMPRELSEAELQNYALAL